MFYQNVTGQVVQCQMTNLSDGSEFTGAGTVYVIGDGGVQATGSVGSGLSTHEGHGLHSYRPAQAETNYECVSYTFVGSGAGTVSIHKDPEPANRNANVVQISYSGTAADNIEVVYDTDFVTSYDTTGNMLNANLKLVNGGDVSVAFLDESGLQSGVNNALVAIHLDHLLAVDYDPASKPGISTALFNELIESDGGVSRFTANSLELGPTGGDATLANQTTIIANLSVLAGDIGTNGDGLTALPWNAAWDTEVQSECTDALNAYDPPTNAEMVARTLPTGSYLQTGEEYVFGASPDALGTARTFTIT